MDQLATVRPAYGVGSLAEVLPGVLAALGVPGGADPLGLAKRLAGVRRVAVLLVDGLGQQLLPAAARVAPTLADAFAGKLGTLMPITSVFPSTTPTCLVSLGTGAPPGTHGVVGFTVNVPGTTRVLNHVHWSTDPDPATWQPVPTQFARAAAAAVSVSVISRSEYAGSGLTVAAYRGADYRGADRPTALAHEMLAALGRPAGPTLVYGYHPELDRDGHRYGVDSPRWRAAVRKVDKLVARLVAGLPPDGALLVTADHGQLDIPAGCRFDLGADPRLRAGVRVVAGEPRLRHLHTAPGATEDVLSTWREVLGAAVWVASREEAIAAGWFGPVTDAHRPRIGDVVAVCQDRYALLDRDSDPATVTKLVAFHGAWTAAEMLVPLLLVQAETDRR